MGVLLKAGSNQAGTKPDEPGLVTPCQIHDMADGCVAWALVGEGGNAVADKDGAMAARLSCKALQQRIGIKAAAAPSTG